MTRTVLIDGRSGAGKTTLAEQLGACTGFRVVHLDDFYPGWGGLARAGEIVSDHVLAERRAGFWRWDWERDVPGQWVAVDPAEPLIVEGAGSVTRATVAAARRRGLVACVFVHLDAETRRLRALARDPEFAEFWQMWARQEARHIRDELPWDAIDFHVYR